MSYIRRNQKNYIKKEFEGEETEEIEEIEVNRYDSNDLYTTSLNFIIPGISKFSTRSHNLNINIFENKLNSQYVLFLFALVNFLILIIKIIISIKWKTDFLLIQILVLIAFMKMN